MNCHSFVTWIIKTAEHNRLAKFIPRQDCVTSYFIFIVYTVIDDSSKPREFAQLFQKVAYTINQFQSIKVWATSRLFLLMM